MKYIYLNRLFVDGSEVSFSLKTRWKIGTPTGARVSSLSERVQAIFASGRGSLKSGADPLMTYLFWLRKAWFILGSTIKITGNVYELALIALAPESLGGFNFPDFLMFWSSDVPDKISQWLFSLDQMSRYTEAYIGGFERTQIINAIKSVLAKFMGSEFEATGPIGFLTSPTMPRVAGIKPVMSVYRGFMKELTK